ncbi:glycosylation-dependent cell adhesion molecule 1-like [Ursus maritimus]|uniref:Glycosylation-dependent cell adhesion molecule 1 n=1 Tax=Ursus maritimus TaxID=29073 RepID=A0A384D768_URSMA|nr:glycosylation-dependent cell adhesion molecule 1-like [Ursus maritimus]XP_026357438.1 glycosylation-dependent cell adhesion molecule 1-like [Ursus arctos]
MKRFAILLLASLASTSLAILGESEEETHWEAQPIDAPAQLIPEKDHISIENSSEEPPISTDELRFEEEDVISSVRRPKNQRLQQLQPIPQEASFRNAAPQSEETTELTLELTPWAATTPEGKLAKLGHEIGKNLDKTMKETMNYLKSLLPHAYEVTRP